MTWLHEPDALEQLRAQPRTERVVSCWKHVDHGWICALYQVDMRRGSKGWHLHISYEIERPGWRDLQALKNQMCGFTATAVEVFPPQQHVRDTGSCVHLWVLPADSSDLGFGLHLDTGGLRP